MLLDGVARRAARRACGRRRRAARGAGWKRSARDVGRRARTAAARRLLPVGSATSTRVVGGARAGRRRRAQRRADVDVRRHVAAVPLQPRDHRAVARSSRREAGQHRDRRVGSRCCASSSGSRRALVHVPRQHRHQLAELHAGDVGADGAVGAADGVGRVGLGVERLEVARARRRARGRCSDTSRGRPSPGWRGVCAREPVGERQPGSPRPPTRSISRRVKP